MFKGGQLDAATAMQLLTAGPQLSQPEPNETGQNSLKRPTEVSPDEPTFTTPEKKLPKTAPVTRLKTYSSIN